MQSLIVVGNPNNWSIRVPGVTVVGARQYLTDSRYSALRNVRVYNLCRFYRYQSLGYYVSLLAAARRHRPLPSVATILDMKSLSVARILTEDIEQLIQRSLQGIKSDKFILSSYFGQNLARRHEQLSARLFDNFQSPLLRGDFARDNEGKWRLTRVRPIPLSEVPQSHRPFLIQAAEAHFARNRPPTRRRRTSLYDLAILVNPDEQYSPSNKGALRRLAAAAKRAKFSVWFIERKDFTGIAEFDALLIRETTAVNHHTYRFAQRAAAEGLVVIDDPDSIAQCSNKVFLAELLRRHGVAIPKTMIVHRDNRDEIQSTVGLPCILKQPDSCFSQGVVKAATLQELDAGVERLLEKSDLVIAQEFMPTEFDWRIGVLDRKPLFAAKYFMVKKHWQIAKSDSSRTRYGAAAAVPMEQVPSFVVRAALRASSLIGDGLYGVDVKQIGRKAYIVEVNDNPNLDAGTEDALLGEALYDRIIQYFVDRLRVRKDGVDGAGVRK